MCTCVMTHGAVEEPRVKKLPAPSHYRPLTLSQRVRGSWHTPAAVSRGSELIDLNTRAGQRSTIDPDSSDLVRFSKHSDSRQAGIRALAWDEKWDNGAEHDDELIDLNTRAGQQALSLMMPSTPRAVDASPRGIPQNLTPEGIASPSAVA